MANDEFREQHETAREVGLKARHETRVERAREREAASEKPKWSDLFGMDPDYTKDAETDERAIRRQVAEEIAEAIEGAKDISGMGEWLTLKRAATIAREIGSKETS